MSTWFRSVHGNASRWHLLHRTHHDRSQCGEMWLRPTRNSAPRERLDTDEIPTPTCANCARYLR